MLGAWLLWAVVVPLLVLVGWMVSSRPGRKWLLARRRALRKRAVRISREVWRATPRGRLQAERRRQPRRLTVGHRRRPEDPTLGRRVARRTLGWVGREVEQARLSWSNRRRRSLLELVRPERGTESTGLCGSTKTVDGHACKNRRMVGAARCWEHRTSWLA